MTDLERPDPDELLARTKAEEQAAKRGKLKIFIGAAAGVGKTYAMLEESHLRKADGMDVVIGYVEPHGRKDTERLLEGFEALPTQAMDYRCATLREFDLDAALARKPQLILLDELAHTNVEGSRHPKRWQDALELLDAGIDVYTTVNIQHVESLNDVVAQITGVIVRETVPDSVIEQADSIELIDLTPEELIKRLKEGKIYKPQQVDQALNSFFRRGNLNALRELALRKTAERVDAQMRAYQSEKAITDVWPAAERILVCIGPGSLAPRLVRAAKRLAVGLRAEWIVAYVETPDQSRLKEAARDQIMRALRLAEELGSQTATLSGTNIVEEVLAYAHQHNISKIVVGKPEKPRWREVLFGSTVDMLVRRSGVIDVYVIHGEHDATEPKPTPIVLERTSNWQSYAWALVILAVCTAFAYFADTNNIGEANVIMVFLLGVLIAAFRCGRGPALMNAILGVAAFDVFFVEPRGTFAVSDTRYLITFAVMAAVGLAVGTLVARTRRQADLARERERRTQEHYEMSRELASTRGVYALAQCAERHVADVFDSKVTMLLPDGENHLQPEEETAQSSDLRMRDVRFQPDERERGVAQWAYEHNEPAGLSTQTLASSRAMYLPLVASRGTVGVLGVMPKNAQLFRSPEQLHSLETFANQTALAIERARLADEAEGSRVRIETEQLRNTLLSSVSHDLRSPLASITGAASTMIDADGALDGATRRELAESIYDEAERLNTLVRNLLDMTRLESGAMPVTKEPQQLEEVVGYVLDRMERQLHDREVKVSLSPDLPLVPLDSVLASQVFINLIENALKYTPAGAPIDISARHEPNGNLAQIEVADRGPGLPAGQETRVFEKFQRVENGNGTPTGAGLGLAICRAIVEAHGGRIWAQNREGGGATFRFTLPL